MCSLILLLDIDVRYPLLVAGNRDERRDRPSAPPGLFVGERRRMLSPRDKQAGGTWMAVSEHGLFAGLTNLAGTPVPEGATSRGVLPHAVLDEDDLESAGRRLEEMVERERFGGFQLVVSDRSRALVFAHDGERLERHEVAGGSIVISNEHRLGELELPLLEYACEDGLSTEERLDRLAKVLLDTGTESAHRVLKQGGSYGTVSSSLIAIDEQPRDLIWRFAPGQPDEKPYRDYGNLSRRLVEG